MKISINGTGKTISEEEFDNLSTKLTDLFFENLKEYAKQMDEKQFLKFFHLYLVNVYATFLTSIYPEKRIDMCTVISKNAIDVVKQIHDKE